MHYRNVILKARQIGFSTFSCLLLLDMALWRKNQNIGIISHSRDAASELMRKVIFTALDNMDPRLLALNPVIARSATSISFTNGSHLTIGTSLRGMSLNALLVSEYGKICARTPQKAEEVLTGSIQTLGKNSLLITESTAESVGNEFHRLCKKGKANEGLDNLSKLDLKLFFFPWWKQPDYTEDIPYSKVRSDYLDQYFTQISEQGIELREERKAWYALKHQELGDKIFQEYPSTFDESFAVNSLANFYLSQINGLEKNGHITNIYHIPQLPVQIALDLGVYTSGWVYQVQKNGEIYVLQHYWNVGGDVSQVVKEIQALPFIISKWYLPHDANSRIQSVGISWYDMLSNFGLTCEVLPREDVQLGIDRVKLNLARTWFNKDTCSLGIEHLKAYKRKFNLRLGMYGDEPEHDINSHSSDACRYMYASIEYSQPHSTTGELRDKHNAFLQRRNQILI